MKINLKKIATIVLPIILLASCKNNSVTINGIITKENADSKVTLSNAGNIVKETSLDKENSFSLSFKELKKGYYKLNDKIIFLNPGSNITVKITSDSTTVTSKNYIENKILKEIEDYTNLYFKDHILKENFNLNEKKFKKYLNVYKTRVSNLLKDDSLDKDFVRIETKKANYYTQNILSEFAYKHGVNFSILNKAIDYLDPKNREKMKVFDSLTKEAKKGAFKRSKINEITSACFKNFNWNDEDLFFSNAIGYNSLLNKKIKREANNSYNIEYGKTKDYKSLPPLEVFERDVVLDSISSKPIKDILLKKLTNNIIKMKEKYADDAVAIYKKTNPNRENLEEISVIYTNLKKIQKGQPSPMFVNYKTPNDINVSLSDFKGKYVYIDVWATWCGPCKKEIPYLKKVEEQFHSKNIEFISISVDVEKQRQNWKQMVSDLKLSGVQIMADKDFKSDFISSYNIASIPRFLLIDPNGNIISSNAPRPSDPKLITLFNELNI